MPKSDGRSDKTHQFQTAHLQHTEEIPVRLDLSNAELSLKRYWRGPRSQEVGEERDYT